MKKLFVIIVIFLSVKGMFAQVPTSVMDEKSQTMILVGATDSKYLTEGDFGVSYASEFANYNPDTTLIRQMSAFLLNNASDLKLTIVLGTWCGDSKEQLPRFYKILSKLTTPFHNIELICVDREKKGGNLDLTSLKIEKVPTFIFYRNNIEIGRIIETPLKTIENDMMRIFFTK